MRSFKRVHNRRTAVELTQHADVWHIQISLKGRRNNPVTITGFANSLSLAKTLADREITKYGHVCSEACKDWVEVP